MAIASCHGMRSPSLFNNSKNYTNYQLVVLRGFGADAKSFCLPYNWCTARLRVSSYATDSLSPSIVRYGTMISRCHRAMQYDDIVRSRAILYLIVCLCHRSIQYDKPLPLGNAMCLSTMWLLLPLCNTIWNVVLCIMSPKTERQESAFICHIY